MTDQRNVFLYAFDKVSRVVYYQFLIGDDISITKIIRTGEKMRKQLQVPVDIYAVDNRRGLRKMYMETILSDDFTKSIEFKDMVQRCGILVPSIA